MKEKKQKQDREKTPCPVFLRKTIRRGIYLLKEHT